MPDEFEENEPPLQEPMFGISASKMNTIISTLKAAKNPLVAFSPDFSTMQSSAMRAKDDRIDEVLLILEGYEWLMS